MKKILIAGTSLIALATVSLTGASMAADLSAAPVASAWDAFVSAGAGYTWVDGDDFGDEQFDDFAAEVRGTAAYQFANGFGLQGDVVFNHQALDVSFADDGSVQNVDVAGHAFYRNESFLLGVFGQYGATLPDLGSEAVDIDRSYFGGEAQAYFGNFTLYAQGGWQGLEVEDLDEELDGFFINAEARYFAGENLKFAINGGYEEIGVDGTDFQNNTMKVGGSVEYRLDANPLSVFANVNYANTEGEVFDFEYSETRVMAGIKLNFGSQTLLERDRAGATLDPVKPAALPIFFSF